MGWLSRLGLGLGRGADDVERDVVRTDDEWRRALTAEQHRVLRRKGTQRPFGPEVAAPDEEGWYLCAGCGARLFRSEHKFDSGTGWPSFTEADPTGVDTRRDLALGIPRTEVLCHACGGHLGHVFGDGPAPSGRRYCINDCALRPRDW